MSRTYLLNPPFMPGFSRSMRWQDTGRGGTLYYPVWLAYATGAVEQEGHEAKLVDAPAWDWRKKDVLRDAAEFDPKLVIMDTSFTSLNNDLSVLSDIKDATGATTMVVGEPGSVFSDQILNTDCVDIVAQNNFELTAVEVAESLDQNGSFDGIAGMSFYRDSEIVHNEPRPIERSADLDDLPFVSKVYDDHLNIDDYFLGQSLYPEVQIITGRGCPYECTFCSWPQTFTGRSYRYRSVEDIVDEFEWVEQNLPEVNEIFIETDTFALNEKRVRNFTEELRSRDVSITWACNARADGTLGLDTMKRMRETGCRLFVTGFESGSDEMLMNMKKDITTDQIREYCRKAKEAGVLIHGDYIIGLPGETEKTIQETRELIFETKPEVLQVAVATPFPGTEFFEWAHQNGHLNIDSLDQYLDQKGHQRAVIDYPNLTYKKINQKVDQLLKDYYLSPKYVPLAARQVLRENGWQEFKRIAHEAKVFLGYISDRDYSEYDREYEAKIELEDEHTAQGVPGNRITSSDD
ncbi:radical SAM protein [Halobellus sp. EA9]|uniref:radical SAM protein n=1 Tax=Halobellus sp. EA9 TaxID=3421647 RepID=UPI003EBE3903